jgi:hypothetical protein
MPDARQIAAAFRRTERTIKKFEGEAIRDLMAAEKEAAELALKFAREFSSGRISSDTLRVMGHPYATRAPRPPMDPAIINEQSGRFLRSWKIVGPRRTSVGLRTKLVNRCPYAIYLWKGTRRMIARPILERVREKLLPYRERFIKAALKKATRL